MLQAALWCMVAKRKPQARAVEALPPTEARHRYTTGIDQLLHRGPQLLDVGLHGQAVPLHAELVLEGWPDAEGGGDAARRLLARIGEDLVR